MGKFWFRAQLCPVVFSTQELSPPPLLPLPNRHTSKDVHKHTRLVTSELSLHFFVPDSSIHASSLLLHPSFWSHNTSSQGMESSLTLNLHCFATWVRTQHQIICAVSTTVQGNWFLEHSQPSGTFFYQDTISVQLVTPWADLPLICEEYRQICWKI